MIEHYIIHGRSSACFSLLLDLKMLLTNTRLNGANVLPLRISLLLLNGSISGEYTLDWTSRMINSSAFWSSNGFSSLFSLCSADFRQLSVNRLNHAVTQTKDNPISSSPFVLTRYHLVSWGSNHNTFFDTSSFFTFFNYLLFILVASFVPVSFIPLSSRFSVDIGLSNLHSGKPLLDFVRNSHPFHHKFALANSSTVRPLVPRSAGFTSVGT